jgi:hypothetical protein
MIEGVFPDEIFVKQIEDSDDTLYLAADESVESLEAEDGEPVAVYKLVHVGKVITSRRFVAPPNGGKR